MRGHPVHISTLLHTKRRPYQPKEVRGLSKFGRRGGKKAEHGAMVMFGSHNLIPSVRHDKAIPAIYNPKQLIDRNTNALMLEHADALSELEHRTIPALAHCRDQIADKHDPNRIHRLSDRCSAFALSLALHYVVTSHDDSGKAAEGILFVNATGPLPPGHSWDFVVGGHILPLPTERGKAAFIFVEGEGVQHGTLPTSATEPTCDHGNFGSALVTKDKMIQALERQGESGKPTPKEWTAQALYRAPPASLDANACSEAAAPPGDALITACGDVGASGGGATDRVPLAEVPTTRAAVRERDGILYTPSERERGALVAPSRTGEGYRLPCGNWQTCLVDATYNGIMTLAPCIEPSRARMVTQAVPKLGNVRQASWASMQAALVALQYPLALVEATARFMHDGGPMLNMLRTRNAVLIVGLHVRIDGTAYQHCIMLSTIPEPQAPYGKMVDNHGHMRPVYLEEKDLSSKPAAARAFRDLVEQNPAARDCSELSVEPSDVYELVATPSPDHVLKQGNKRPADDTPISAKTPRLGDRVCAECKQMLPIEAFSKTQRKSNGAGARCRGCVG